MAQSPMTIALARASCSSAGAKRSWSWQGPPVAPCAAGRLDAPAGPPAPSRPGPAAKRRPGPTGPGHRPRLGPGRRPRPPHRPRRTALDTPKREAGGEGGWADPGLVGSLVAERDYMCIHPGPACRSWAGQEASPGDGTRPRLGPPAPCGHPPPEGVSGGRLGEGGQAAWQGGRRGCASRQRGAGAHGPSESIRVRPNPYGSVRFCPHRRHARRHGDGRVQREGTQ